MVNCFPVGVHRFELWTSSLSAMRSNQLSYTPLLHLNYRANLILIIFNTCPSLAGTEPCCMPNGT